MYFSMNGGKVNLGFRLNNSMAEDRPGFYSIKVDKSKGKY